MKVNQIATNSDILKAIRPYISIEDDTFSIHAKFELEIESGKKPLLILSGLDDEIKKIELSLKSTFKLSQDLNNKFGIPINNVKALKITCRPECSPIVYLEMVPLRTNADE